MHGRFPPPMLSNLTMWDAGTSGAIGGAYALKLATRAKPGTFCTAIKRYTFRTWGPLRVEAIVTFKPEAGELELGTTWEGDFATDGPRNSTRRASSRIACVPL